MLYERVRKLCHAHGISVTNLEKELGFGNGTITKWDNSSPSLAKIKAVAEYFNMPISELIDENKKEPTESSELDKYIEMLRTRPEMRLLLDTQDGASKEQVEENVRFLDALRKAKNAD